MKEPSAKNILRAIIEESNKCKKTYVIITENIPYWKEWYHYLAIEMGCDNQTWKKVYRLHKRYKRFCYHLEEVVPNWKELKRLYYADNSVELIQVNKWGDTRKVLEVAPHGDRCF